MFTSLDPRFSKDQFHVSTPITKLKALGWACLMSKCSRWDGNMSKSIWEKENMNNNYSITIQKPFNILFNKQLFNITIPPFFNCSFNTKPRFFVTDVQLHGVRFWLPRSWKHGFPKNAYPQISCFIMLDHALSSTLFWRNASTFKPIHYSPPWNASSRWGGREQWNHNQMPWHGK